MTPVTSLSNFYEFGPYGTEPLIGYFRRGRSADIWEIKSLGVKRRAAVKLKTPTTVVGRPDK